MNKIHWLRKGYSYLQKERQWHYVIISAAILFVFYPSLQGGFIYQSDDSWQVLNNEQIDTLNPKNILQYLTSFYRGQYSPVNTFLYSLLYFFWGLNPLVFHLLNLILHALNALLVYNLILRLLKYNGDDLIRNHPIAFFVSIMFGIHPTQVEAVVWISSSKVILYAFFFLCSLLQYVKYVERRRKINYWSAFILFVLSIGSKEQAVVLPFCLFIIDYFLSRKEEVGFIVKEKIPFLSVALAFGVITLLAQQSTGYQLSVQQNYYPLYQRIVLAAYSGVTYICNVSQPVYFWSNKDFPFRAGQSMPIMYWVYLGLVLLMFCFALSQAKTSNRYGKIILFSVLFFIINLVLTLHIIPMVRWVLMADRYTYLSSIGVYLIIVTGAVAIEKKYPLFRKLIFSVLVVYILSSGFASINVVKVWLSASQ